MPHFVRGLAEVGAEVLGVGDQPPGTLAPETRSALSDYLRVRSLWDEATLVEEVRRWLSGRRLDRVECLWEPGMLLAARLREALGVPGLNAAQTLPFRNKEEMKRLLDAAGIRTPRHLTARDEAGIRGAAERIGFPLILKPIDGAGSADTYRVSDAAELTQAIAKVRHVRELSVEEFIDGEEYTFDTVSIAGRPAFYNIAWYRPRPLKARSEEWISPQVIALRDPDQPLLREGVKMGLAVLEALGFESGFTHMEWYMKADGEVVFGEIGGRPPGAHQVDQMNYACDIDVFRGWADAVCFGRFRENVRRRYNVATIYKRAIGEGRIQRIEGLEAFKARHGAEIVWENLLPVGAPRRNWKQTLVSDGFVILRHPDLAITLAMADEFGEDVRLYAA
ncbi:MAG: ATP-grasp domain-containing protein [Thermoanaerobaculia bacterium]|nr:ATP-grasp domain-containing protein [Thermoanaerobaculia bacterium]MBP9826090.1 ATP-grasp domain-containing protein [Thermoanaerobaculia bacterium]